MDVPDHIASLREEGELLAGAAERAGLVAPVPSCPGWRVRDLLAHLGYVHRWAGGCVAQARTEAAPGHGEDEVLRLAPPEGELISWFRDGHASLVAVLAGAAPSVRCWTLFPAASPLAFWARRQAHETAIHRVDSQLAAAASTAGEPPRPFSPAFAADGADECLMGFGRRRPRLVGEAPATLRFRATDAGPDATWTIEADNGGSEITRTPAAAPLAPGRRFCEVTAPASDLYLLLWNRPPSTAPAVRGDPALLEAWREEIRVRWS